jgi:hypothetical protein
MHPKRHECPRTQQKFQTPYLTFSMFKGDNTVKTIVPRPKQTLPLFSSKTSSLAIYTLYVHISQFMFVGSGFLMSTSFKARKETYKGPNP